MNRSVWISLFISPLLLIAGFGSVSDDLESAYNNLKEAQSKKDVAQVKECAAKAHSLASKAKAEEAPAADADKENWKTRVAYANEVDQFTEYAIYATSLQSSPAEMVDLLSTLEQQNPKSKYLADAYGRYFYALSQTGAAAKIPAVAEKALGNLPDNDELLLVLADMALNNKQNDKALRHAERLVTVLNKRAKPEGVSAADWERKKSAALGRGYWIAGMVYAEKTQFFKADQNLKAALPLISGNEGMLGVALFNLGLANYQLGKAAMNKAQVLQAATYSEQAAKIKGPVAQQAWKNAQVMKTEAAKMR